MNRAFDRNMRELSVGGLDLMEKWIEGEEAPLSQGFHHLRHAQDLDRSLDVVGEHGQAHLRIHAFQALGEEVALVPGALDGAERVLSQLFA